LLHSLNGPALKAGKAFPITEENCPKALQRLNERLDNSTLIFPETKLLYLNSNKSRNQTEYSFMASWTRLDRESIKRSTLLNKAAALRFKYIALFASAVTSPKVPVSMATTTTAEEMPEIRLQREDERRANEGITARYLAMYASM